MRRMTYLKFGQRILIFLLAIPGGALASPLTPGDYKTNKPLLLEIRYCTCAAADAGAPPSRLLPDFLKTSNVLKVSVSRKDRGFLASRDFSMGYELSPVKNKAGRFRFRYAGKYVENGGSTTGNAELVLTEGKWVTLFGSSGDSENGSQPTSVAVRLK